MNILQVIKLVVLGSTVAAQSRNKIQKRPYKVHIFYMSCARSRGGGGSYCFSFLPYAVPPSPSDSPSFTHAQYLYSP